VKAKRAWSLVLGILYEQGHVGVKILALSDKEHREKTTNKRGGITSLYEDREKIKLKGTIQKKSYKATRHTYQQLRYATGTG